MKINFAQSNKPATKSQTKFSDQKTIQNALQGDSLQKRKILKDSVIKYTPEKKSTFISLYYGLSNYLGDLGGNAGKGGAFLKDVNSKQRTSFVGFSISHLRKEKIGARLTYMSGNIAGSDQDAGYNNKEDAAYFRHKRNLDFKTKISEWALLLEVYPLKFINPKNKWYRFPVQPYILYGFGHYKFNPQGSYFDAVTEEQTWVDLQPLGTEGQGMNEYPDRKPYKLSQFNMPYGLGFQYSLGKKTIIGIEYVGRKLFTDYLDDVSTTYIDPNLFGEYLGEEDALIAASLSNKSNLTSPDDPYKVGNKRGNAKANDFYYSFNLKLSIQINKQSNKRVNKPTEVKKDK